MPRADIAATLMAPVRPQVIAMSSRISERLRNEALSLPRAERAELACDLVQSLDGPVDADARSARDAEILRRLDEVASGDTQIIDRAEFARRMREQLARPQVRGDSP